MYKNHNLWQRLTACVLGQYYTPKNYSNAFLAGAVEKTCQELTDLEHTLQQKNITVLRPSLDPVVNLSLHPPISPAHHLIMLDTVLYETHSYHGPFKTKIDWPVDVTHRYQNIFDHVKQQGNIVKSLQHDQINSASVYHMGKKTIRSKWTTQIELPNTEWITFYKADHLDQQFCIPAPGLIVSATDTANSELSKLFYKTYFPDYEVYYLKDEFTGVPSILDWQRKNNRSNNLDKYMLDAHPDQVKWTATKSLSNIQVLDQDCAIIGFCDAELESVLMRYGVDIMHHNITYQGLLHINLGCLITALDRQL
jgi:hypothetical protein